jgi:hypothetical protein
MPANPLNKMRHAIRQKQSAHEFQQVKIPRHLWLPFLKPQANTRPPRRPQPSLAKAIKEAALHFASVKTQSLQIYTDKCRNQNNLSNHKKLACTNKIFKSVTFCKLV